MMKYYFPLLLVFSYPFLNGCSGWHLRGVVDGEPVSYSVHVSYSRAEQVGRAMSEALRSRGARSVSTSKDADYSISVLNERFKRKVVSIDPKTGYVREVELNLSCEIVARDKNGTLVIPRQILRLNRDYYFDELSAEFTSNRRESLERDLAQDAATTIVMRLDSSPRGSSN